MVTIQKHGNATIEFDLTTSGLPSGASAKIVGVEFPTTYTEPTGNFAPGNVFDNPHTITVNGNNHTIYGAAKAGSSTDLILTDDDEVTSGEEGLSVFGVGGVHGKRGRYAGVYCQPGSNDSQQAANLEVGLNYSRQTASALRGRRFFASGRQRDQLPTTGSIATIRANSGSSCRPENSPRLNQRPETPRSDAFLALTRADVC